MPKQQSSACGLAALVRGITVLLTSTPNEVPEVVGPASWTFRDRPFFLCQCARAAAQRRASSSSGSLQFSSEGIGGRGYLVGRVVP